MSPTRRNALGLLAGGAATLAAVRASAAPGAPQTELPDTDEPATALDTTSDRNDHMLAPVSINGQGPFNFLLDTGANISCVSHRLAARLDLKSGEQAQVHTVVGVRSRPMVVLDRLQVGPRNRRNVRAPSLPIKSENVDGVLGVDWLKGQRLVLDFKGRKMEITKSRADFGEPGRVVVVPARRRHGQLTIVDAELDGKPISAILDSGAQGTLCNRRLRDMVRATEARTRRGREPEPPQFVNMETLAGESFVGESVFLPFLRLGGLHLGNVPVTYADMHVFDIWGLKDVPSLVLGMDLLSQFEQVSLDFGRSAVRFDFV
jgi:predicted aspartyl protease